MANLFGWCFRKLTSSSFTRKLVSELDIPEKTCWQQFASIYPLSSSISYIIVVSLILTETKTFRSNSFCFLKPALNRCNKFNWCRIHYDHLSNHKMRVFSQFRRHVFLLNIFVTCPKQNSSVRIIYFYNYCFCYGSEKENIGNYVSALVRIFINRWSNRIVVWFPE